jgi:Zn-dependent protease with chaperone function
MKFDQYVSLIQRLEKFAAERRGAYHFRILLLIVLGYAYFVGLIVLFALPIPLVGILIFLAPEAVLRILFYTVKLWWAVIPGLGLYFGFIGSAIRSITAKVPDPPGRDLLPGEAPKLYEFVENTCDTLKAARPARIIVNDEFNAAVAAMPRFGIFGRKILLIIGLPLMKAISPEQLKAALAHEIGHISGRHGVFTKWAYQMREAWGRLIDSQEAANHKFASLYRGFVNWFFPYFTAYSFVLMREHEKDADQDAVRLTAVESLGEALILLETKGRHIDEVFWREIHEENLAKETPAEKLFSRMLESLNEVNSELASVALSKAMSVPTDFSDSHPSLAERLQLIGYPLENGLPRQPKPAAADAATYFLNDGGRSLAAEYDRAWDEQATKDWKNRHLHFQESHKRIVELNTKVSAEELSRDELLELAERQAEREGIAASLPTMLKAAERFPDDPVVLFNIGGVRLSLTTNRDLKILTALPNSTDRSSSRPVTWRSAISAAKGVSTRPARMPP